MKRIIGTVLGISVVSISLCGFSITPPAPELAIATVMQSTSIRAISAIPVPVWLIVLPFMTVLLLLCVAPLIDAASTEE